MAVAADAFVSFQMAAPFALWLNGNLSYHLFSYRQVGVFSIMCLLYECTYISVWNEDAADVSVYEVIETDFKCETPTRVNERRQNVNDKLIMVQAPRGFL